MAIWAIADLHLSFGVPDKSMAVFGPRWEDHAGRIERGWRGCVQREDLVLIAGDISWAMRPEEAEPDLEWIDHLPGTKLLIRGNHDYWWGSLAKLRHLLPPTCHAIQNNSFTWQNIGFAGARLWDLPRLRFDHLIERHDTGSTRAPPPEANPEADEKIYRRELGKLEMSLKSLPASVSRRIAMTHYPPIGPNLEETEASRLLEQYGVEICVFGHLHNVKSHLEPFGLHGGVRYFLTACDFLKDFRPLRLL